MGRLGHPPDKNGWPIGLPGRVGLGPEIPAITQAGLLTATRFYVCPFGGTRGQGSCMCWECPVMNATSESPRLSPIQAPGALVCHPGALWSLPASQGQAGLGLWHQDQTQLWVTCPSSASACQHHLPTLPGPRRAQRALNSVGQGHRPGIRQPRATCYAHRVPSLPSRLQQPEQGGVHQA